MWRGSGREEVSVPRAAVPVVGRVGKLLQHGSLIFDVLPDGFLVVSKSFFLCVPLQCAVRQTNSPVRSSVFPRLSDDQRTIQVS